MNHMELMDKTAETTGYPVHEIENIYQALLETLSSVVTSGESVNFGSDFGGFIVKQRLYKLNDNSPRTQKKARYQVTFRPYGRLKKNLEL